MLLATALVDTPARITAGAQTLPVTWPASSVLAFGVRMGWRGGLVAAVALADLTVVAFDPPTRPSTTSACSCCSVPSSATPST